MTRAVAAPATFIPAPNSMEYGAVLDAAAWLATRRGADPTGVPRLIESLRRDADPLPNALATAFTSGGMPPDAPSEPGMEVLLGCLRDAVSLSCALCPAPDGVLERLTTLSRSCPDREVRSLAIRRLAAVQRARLELCATPELDRSRPRLSWDPAVNRLLLRLAASPTTPVGIVFTSPAWLEFAGDRLSSIHLLDIPELVRRPVALCDTEPGVELLDDCGWLWIRLGTDEMTARLTGIAQAEFTLDGERLTAIDAQFTWSADARDAR
jgi:hypothetical protein